MRASPLVGALGALTISAAAAHHACACSCAPSDFYADFAGSNAVFIGEVLDISSPGPEYPPLVTVTFRIETAWKGAAASSTTHVVTASSEAACGFPFRVGARYLVYAYRPGVPPASDELWATLCTRTHETSPKDPDLALLSSPLQHLNFTVSPNPSLGWTRLAWTIVGDPASSAATSPAGALVFAGPTSPGDLYTSVVTTVGSSGAYEFKNLPLATYFPFCVMDSNHDGLFQPNYGDAIGIFGITDWWVNQTPSTVTTAARPVTAMKTVPRPIMM